MQLKKIIAGVVAGAITAAAITTSSFSLDAANETYPVVSSETTVDSGWTDIKVFENGDQFLSELLNYKNFTVTFKLNDDGLAAANNNAWSLQNALGIYFTETTAWNSGKDVAFGYPNPWDGTIFNTTDTYTATVATADLLAAAKEITEKDSDEEAIANCKATFRSANMGGYTVLSAALTDPIKGGSDPDDPTETDPIEITLDRNVIDAENSKEIMLPTGSLTLSDIKKINVTGVTFVRADGENWANGCLGANFTDTTPDWQTMKINDEKTTWTWELPGVLKDGLQIQKWSGVSLTFTSVEYIGEDDVVLAIAKPSATTEPSGKTVEIPFEKKDYTLTVIDASDWKNPDFTKAAQVNLALTDVKGVTIGTTTYGEMKDKVYKLSGIDWSAYNLPEGLEASDISVTLYSKFGEKWVWCSQGAPEIDFSKPFNDNPSVTDDMAIMEFGIQINVNGNKGGIEAMDIGAEVKLPLSGSSNPDPDPDTTTTTTTEDEPIYTWPAQSEAPTTTAAETEAPATEPAETDAPVTVPSETEAPATDAPSTEPAGTTEPDVVIPGQSEIIEGSDEGETDVSKDTAIKIEIPELNVTIEASGGTFEETVSKIIAEVTVKLSDASENDKATVIAAAIKGLANASESVSVNSVISVTLKDQDGNTVQPVNGTTVKVTLPYDGKSNYAAYIDGAEVEFIKLTIEGNYASFEAKHFSDYYLVSLSDDAVKAVEGGNAAGDTSKPSGDKTTPATGFAIAFIPAAAAAIAVVASKKKK